MDNGDHWADTASARFQGSAGGNDCPWVEAAQGLVLGEFGIEGGPPAPGGGLLAATGPVTSLMQLASGPITVPIAASTTYTANGTGEPCLGQVPRSTGTIDPRVRGNQVRVGYPGTSRVLQFKGRPAAGPC